MQTTTTRPRAAKLLRIWWVPLLLLFVAACHSDMYDQPRLEAYKTSNGFNEGPYADGSAMQLPPSGTVARGNLRTDREYFTGLDADGQEIEAIPEQVEISADLLAQGQKQYNIFCATCHGTNGNLQGSAVAALFNPRPASLIEGDLLQAPSGHFYNVITNGVVRDGNQNMYPYASRIEPADRWAIVAYVRALQQNAESPLDVPLEQIR
jgi:mono/diheme cytochrome c family protein